MLQNESTAVESLKTSEFRQERREVGVGEGRKIPGSGSCMDRRSHGEDLPCSEKSEGHPRQHKATETRRSPEDRAISAPDRAKVGGGLSCHPSQRGLCERICTSLQGVYKTHEHDRKHHI